MDDDIALLRREALSSISTKVSRGYGVDSLFGRHEHNPRKPDRGRRIASPDITREVLGAFGLKPKMSHQYIKSSRSQPSGRPNRKSTISSRSRSSDSRSYSSYSSSSHSRSRSSSSSSDQSTYSRSSSYSASSRSRSPRYIPHSPPHKMKKRVPQPLSRSNDKLLERHHRKKPRYTEDLSPPPDPYYHDNHSNRRISKNTQYSSYSSRKRPSNRPESGSYHPYSNPRRIERSDDYHHQSRHHTSKGRISRQAHHSSPPPPHYSHRLPPSRAYVQKDRHERHTSYDSGKHYRSKPGHVESAPHHRGRSGYSEVEHSSSRRQPHTRPHHSSSRGNGHDKDRHEDHISSLNLAPNHETKERFIIVEESSYPNDPEPSRSSSGKQNTSLRGESSRGARNISPNHTLVQDKPVVKQKLSEWETDINPHASGDTECNTEMVSPSVQPTGDDSFAEELDYNEDMDNLDLHPNDMLDVRVDEVLEDTGADKGRQSPSWSGKDSTKEVDDNESGSIHSKMSSGDEETRPISSPLRVSPERSDQREESWSIHGRVPVKQRLYISKQKIEEKKRSARYQSSSKSQSELRPSLANRLGPPHHSRHGSQRGHRRHWTGDAPKGSAMAIAEAYRKHKEKEAEKKVVLLRPQKGEKSGGSKDNEGNMKRKINRL